MALTCILCSALSVALTHYVTHASSIPLLSYRNLLRAPDEKCYDVSMFPKSKYAYPPVKPSSSSSSLSLTPLQKKTCIRGVLNDEIDPSASVLDDDTQRIRTRNCLPKSTTVEAIIEMYCERPLPAIPRIPSSIYAFSAESTGNPQGLSPMSMELSQASFSPQSPVIPPVRRTKTTLVAAKGLTSATHLSQLYRKESTKQPSTPNSISERQTPILERQTPILERQTPISERQTPLIERQTPILKPHNQSAVGAAA